MITVSSSLCEWLVYINVMERDRREQEKETRERERKNEGERESIGP